MKKAFCILAAFLSSLANATPVATVDVRIDGYRFAPEIVQVGNRAVHAGQYYGTMDREPFTAWCAELEEFLQFGSVNEYQIIPADEAYGAETALKLAQLLSWTKQTGQPTDASESAAIQVDIWSIQAGDDPQGDYSGALITERPIVLRHRNRQDIVSSYPLIAVPVGEPTPAIPFALGIGFIAGYLATRRKP